MVLLSFLWTYILLCSQNVNWLTENLHTYQTTARISLLWALFTSISIPTQQVCLLASTGTTLSPSPLGKMHEQRIHNSLLHWIFLWLISPFWRIHACSLPPCVFFQNTTLAKQTAHGFIYSEHIHSILIFIYLLHNSYLNVFCSENLNRCTLCLHAYLYFFQYF